MVREFEELLSLDKTICADLFSEVKYPWEIFDRLSEYIVELGKSLPSDKYDYYEGDIWVAKSAKVAGSVAICGPCIICDNAEIRHCAYIRGSVIIGRGCVLGNSCEVKSSVLFESACVPHFNYVGNSILGFCAHLGAGAITSNLKSDGSLVTIRLESEIKTGLRKLGAIIGDKAEIGCGAVLNPGSIIGKGAMVYPLSSVRGFVPSNSIYKESGKIVRRV
ncbi:MAG: UDP-N-acetylglucosamine pyrophosphorylase [Clostridia bacterium]|nr:UDP-N-acetylglucosamine pyrophosphorylase [Clostridia bacterium]